MLYARVNFTRSSGLGNKLFPWARAIVFCHQFDATLIPPKWPSLRRGPLAREGSILGGVPILSYPGKIWLFNNFRQGQVASKYLVRASRAPVIDEKLANSLIGSGQFNEINAVIDFAGDADHFSSLHGHRSLIKTELEKISVQSVPIYENKHSLITINVRIGKDFKCARSPDDYVHKGGIRTPIEWYVKVLRKTRENAGYCMPSYIISDGSERELRPILNEPSVHYLKTRYAIQDLLLLAQSTYIIGAGGSSFTAWGAFLSEADVITIDGQSMNWFGLDKRLKGSVKTLSL